MYRIATRWSASSSFVRATLVTGSGAGSTRLRLPARAGVFARSCASSASALAVSRAMRVFTRFSVHLSGSASLPLAFRFLPTCLPRLLPAFAGRLPIFVSACDVAGHEAAL
eukprot:7378071-Prymnesium_polylepis.1